MRVDPFKVCWDRIDRANTYRNRIAGIWNAFAREEDPYSPCVDMQDDGTGSIWIEQIAPMPHELAFIIGEFLYQLRAALDACVYEVACVNSGKRPPPYENVLEFPFCQPGTFKDSGWKIKPLTDEQRAIIEAVQPYNAPELPDNLLVANWNRSLGILNDWARKDRHRKLHVLASWASNMQPLLVIPKGTVLAEIFISEDTFLLENECEIATFRIEGWQRGMKVYANANLALDIALDEVPPPCHNSDHLGNRLLNMEMAVQVVVDTMARTVGVKPRGDVYIRIPPEVA